MTVIMPKGNCLSPLPLEAWGMHGASHSHGRQTANVDSRWS